MAKNIAEFRKKGIQIVAISVDPAEESRQLAKKRKIPFPLLSDPEMKVISRYGVGDSEAGIAIPSVFYIEQGGIVGWVHIGEAIFIRPSSEELLQAITAKR